MQKLSAAKSVIVGLGKTGLSCARYLHARSKRFAVTDSRDSPPELAALMQFAPGVDVRVGGFDDSILEDAIEVVLSPGVSLREPLLQAAMKRNLPIVGDIELFARSATAPIVGITGTNGKSTVTTLVAEMAARAGRRVLAGGNLGRPALDLLTEPTPDFYVLELSSYQLETTRSLRLAAATVLNVTPDHLDRYDSIEAYAQAKARIFAQADVAIVNADDNYVRAMPKATQPVIDFSLQGVAQYRVAMRDADIELLRHDVALVSMSQLKIAGLHNAANALASLALCEALQLDCSACLLALRDFAGLPHRAQWVADVNGVRYIDDSKGTNVGATLAAVEGMQGPLILIAGGQGKAQDFTPLATGLRNKVRHVVLIGQDAPLLASTLTGVCATEHARTMDDAVMCAARVAHTGDTVLLSPACASLDMFRDYAHRGDTFAAAVRRLA
ncbi:MAG: UDP-N-acetylmuramoyl-L-alanine--D-glutamate ligase [Candidatus Obscuribacterales bacterium]|nr:UDP-N-acetylmuramoyl-L-alanine--D-glutamate ligase [Steroidobacteraceae bacterium]